MDDDTSPKLSRTDTDMTKNDDTNEITTPPPLLYKGSYYTLTPQDHTGITWRDFADLRERISLVEEKITHINSEKADRAGRSHDWKIFLFGAIVTVICAFGGAYFGYYLSSDSHLNNNGTENSIPPSESKTLEAPHKASIESLE